MFLMQGLGMVPMLQELDFPFGCELVGNTKEPIVFR